MSFMAFSCSNSEKDAERLELQLENEIHAEIKSVNNDQNDTSDVLIEPNLKNLERALNRFNFEDSMTTLYNEIGLKELNLDYEPFRHTMIGFYGLRQDGKINDKNLISIIDFTQTSCDKRFYTIDLDTKEVLFNTLVSHGRTTGGNKSTVFSNESGSNASSLGFYVTAETYVGSKGYSMRLDGMDKGYNDQMRRRAVVMHNAKYVSDDWVKKYGRIGRSQGCPALPEGISKAVIDVIKDKTVIFAYYNDDAYLKASNYLNLESLMEKFDRDYIDVTSI